MQNTPEKKQGEKKRKKGKKGKGDGLCVHGSKRAGGVIAIHLAGLLAGWCHYNNTAIAVI